MTVTTCLQVIRSLDRNTGGPVHALEQMSRSLAQRGIEVDIVSTSKPVRKHLDNRGTPKLRTHVFKRQFGRTWSFSYPLWQWLRRHVRAYDVVHITGVFTFPAYIAAHVAAQQGVPYIVRPAGTLDSFALTQKAFKKKVFFNVFIKRVLENAAVIHVTSDKELQGMNSLGVNTTIKVIPLSVSISDHKPVRKVNPQLHVVIVARIHPIKAIPTLIQAIARLRERGRDIRLTIAGDGESDYVSEVKELVSSLTLNDAVTFAGFVGGNEKTQLLREADLFVLPSYQESFGVAVVEAMAESLPVVVSDQVALANIILSSKAGAVVQVDAPDSLADEIESFFDNDYRLRLGQNARLLVESEYGEANQGESLIAMYEDAVQSKRNGT